MFIQCQKCIGSRVAGDFLSANICGDCKGKGFKRSKESYICNKCGDGLCVDWSENIDCYAPYGLVEATVSGGYESTHLSDLTNYQFSMCEKCLRNFFNSCKVPPKVNGNFFESYEEDRKNYENNMRQAEEVKIKMNLNCEEVMKKLAEFFYNFADFEIDRNDLLGKDYAYAIVNIHEEPRSDNDEIRNEIIQKAKDLMPGAAVTYVHQKPARPDTEYEIQICTKNSNLWFELFLWNVEFIHNQK